MGNTLEKTTTWAIPLWKTVNGKIEHVPIQKAVMSLLLYFKKSLAQVSQERMTIIFTQHC